MQKRAISALIIALIIVAGSSMVYAGTISWEFYNDILVSNADVSAHKKEAHIMRHPTDSNRLLAAFIDFASTPERCRVATSSNAGTSWSVASYLPLPSSTSRSNDPVIAVRSTTSGTTWYVGCVAFTDGSYSIGDYSKIYYSTSTDNGSTWSSTVVVREAYCSSSSNCPMVDKPWITVYGSNVYVCYAYMDNFIAWNNGNQSTIRIFVNSKEITSGTAWQANDRVSDRSVQGCNIAVNSNGVIYVVWARLASDTQGKIELSRSFDNGNTFEAPRKVADFTRTPTKAGTCTDAFGCVIGVIANAQRSGFRAPSFPYIAIDSSNNIHIVYQDYSNSTLTDIKYTRSNNCKTQTQTCEFTAPVRILNDNNVSKDQFMPSIVFSGKTNTIHVTALDRRDSTDNTGWRPTHYHCHLLDVNACTQESHWSTSSIGAQSANLDGSSFIGDYYSVTSNSSREAYAVWVDTKTVNADWKYRIWFDRTTT